MMKSWYCIKEFYFTCSKIRSNSFKSIPSFVRLIPITGFCLFLDIQYIDDMLVVQLISFHFHLEMV